MTDSAAHKGNIHHAHASLRCGARTRNGTPCKSPAVKGKKRCRMHGGRNPGAPKGNKRALKHGMRSAEYVAERKFAMQVRRDLKQMVSFVEGMIAACEEHGHGADEESNASPETVANDKAVE